MSYPEGLDFDVAAAANRIHQAYAGYYWMSGDLAWEIAQVAWDLGANPFDLANVIRSESQFNPQAQNVLGDVIDASAHAYEFRDDPKQHTGLIQFSTETARELGTSHGALFVMTPAQQMSVVKRYFARHQPVDTTQRLLMAVFYPEYQDQPPTTAFPANVVAANPDKKTPQDYIDGVNRYARLTSQGQIVSTAPYVGMYHAPQRSMVGSAGEQHVLDIYARELVQVVR